MRLHFPSFIWTEVLGADRWVTAGWSHCCRDSISSAALFTRVIIQHRLAVQRDLQKCYYDLEHQSSFDQLDRKLAFSHPYPAKAIAILFYFIQVPMLNKTLVDFSRFFFPTGIAYKFLLCHAFCFSSTASVSSALMCPNILMRSACGCNAFLL